MPLLREAPLPLRIRNRLLSSCFTGSRYVLRKCQPDVRVTDPQGCRREYRDQPGTYTFDAEERASFLEAEPAAAPFLRPYVDARGYLQGGERWILALQQASPTTLKQLPLVLDRMASVRRYRSRSRRKSTLAIADYPTRYNVEVLPDTSFLVVPKVSSERREYVPIGWLEPPTIPSDLIFVLQNATLADFALLTSAMHMAWLRYIGGRLKSDFRYSIGLVYNTFPLPPGFADADTSALEPLAQAVLDARAAYASATLARPVRPGPDAAQPPKGASRVGSDRRSSLPPAALHVGA